MKLTITPLAFSESSLVNEENPFCKQVIFLIRFSSKKHGCSRSTYGWIDVDMISGHASDEVILRTDLIYRGQDFKAGGHFPSPPTDQNEFFHLQTRYPREKFIANTFEAFQDFIGRLATRSGTPTGLREIKKRMKKAAKLLPA